MGYLRLHKNDVLPLIFTLRKGCVTLSFTLKIAWRIYKRKPMTWLWMICAGWHLSLPSYLRKPWYSLYLAMLVPFSVHQPTLSIMISSVSCVLLSCSRQFTIRIPFVCSNNIMFTKSFRWLCFNVKFVGCVNSFVKTNR